MATELEINGHPGTIHTTLITGLSGSGAFYFTGSNFGYGACMTEGSFNGSIELTGGGSVSGSALTDGVIYELSINSVTAGDGGSVYVFKKRKSEIIIK